MSEEQLKTFLEKATGDASIQDKLKAAADIDSVVAIAKEAGFSIFAEELKKAQSELSFEELEGVAGGDFFGGQCCLVLTLGKNKQNLQQDLGLHILKARAFVEAFISLINHIGIQNTINYLARLSAVSTNQRRCSRPRCRSCDCERGWVYNFR